jgi:DNA-binding NtrC family response regulator
MNTLNSFYPANRNLIFFPTDDCPNEVCEALEAENWRVFIVKSLRQARDLIARHPFYVGLCLLDDDNKRLDQIKRLFNYSTQIKWIMGVPEDFFRNFTQPRQEKGLIFKYCHDYLTFPVCTEQMLYVLGHTYGMAQLSSDNQGGSDGPGRSRKSPVLGENSVMHELNRKIEKIAREESSVLIQGETNTSKEFIASAIHRQSPRSDSPLVLVDCGALEKGQLHAELFGYEQGAFPGAEAQKIGQIESAKGGTLFLDKICELSKDVQTSLLRFIEDKAITRLGGSEQIAVDVRIIAASHRDLDDAVQTGRFRKDLYYRLKELELTLEPCTALA